MTDHGPGRRYELVLRGEVGDRFGFVFEGMRLQRIHGDTVLTGTVRDQSLLHGLIEQIQELGIELVSVNPLSEPPTPGSSTREDDT